MQQLSQTLEREARRTFVRWGPSPDTRETVFDPGDETWSYLVMKPYPPTPKLADVSEELLSSGHLWLREYVVGPRMRFQMDATGLLVFGDRERVFEEVPPQYLPAVRHVRERFDRDAFYDAVDDPAAYTFFGVAPCHVGTDYEWNRLPPFLGHVVWNEHKERYLPIDKAERVFERLGLTPVNTFQKEVNVRDFHPERYDFPSSAWYDGPAVGIVVENRRGGRALLRNAAVDDERESDPIRGDPSEIADTLVTDARIRTAIDDVERYGESVTTAEINVRVFETIVREEYARLDAGGIDVNDLRSAVGTVVGGKVGSGVDI